MLFVLENLTCWNLSGIVRVWESDCIGSLCWLVQVTSAIVGLPLTVLLEPKYRRWALTVLLKSVHRAASTSCSSVAQVCLSAAMHALLSNVVLETMSWFWGVSKKENSLDFSLSREKKVVVLITVWEMNRSLGLGFE